uniref:Uncharacterized protein n=1 Tax=Branchiostoma floridae TaxID=7739 RepID=C3YGJ9_BRAFL|eukprot:XP_002604498.1 hypothetical protein BRAFLDRAFT_79342 [Branchiostoma floridae]
MKAAVQGATGGRCLSQKRAPTQFYIPESHSHGLITIFGTDGSGKGLNRSSVDLNRERYNGQKTPTPIYNPESHHRALPTFSRPAERPLCRAELALMVMERPQCN